MRAVVICAALVAGGCVTARKAAFVAPQSAFGGVSEEIIANLIHDGDDHFSRRESMSELDEAARAYTAALRYHPRDAAILVRLGRVAFRRGLVAHKLAELDNAVRFAERALSARNPALYTAARAGKAPTAVFALAEADDAPALALYAEALLAWSLTHSTATVMAEREAIAAAAENALRLDRAVAFAAADRVLGVLDCVVPEAHHLGEARGHFESAIAIAPGYLPTKLAFARVYAPRMSEPALQRRLLEEIVAADAHALPDAEPENRNAQAMAKAQLARLRSRW